MRMKLVIDLPSRDELVRGLTLHEVHPALGRTEAAVIEAERDLGAAREVLAGLERRVAALPAKVHSGAASPSDLKSALLDRETAALRIGPFEGDLAAARARVAVEQTRAQGALEAAVVRRCQVLGRIAAEVAPVLSELRALESVLAHAVGAVGLGIAWPMSLRDELQVGAGAPVVGNLPWR